jgi:hypothetical protein
MDNRPLVVDRRDETLWLEREQRTVNVTNDRFRSVTNQEPSDVGSADCSHDQQVGFDLFNNRSNHASWCAMDDVDFNAIVDGIGGL